MEDVAEGSADAKTGPKPGVRQHRQPKAQVAARIEVALDGVGEDGRCRPIPNKDWNKLREATWERWTELPEVKAWPSPEDRAEGILPSPPDSAVHDGIVGRALRYVLQQPTNGSGPYDARPIIRKLAEEGLTEVEDFKAQRPAASESVAGPLKTYVKILEQLRDKPEYGTTPEG